MFLLVLNGFEDHDGHIDINIEATIDLLHAYVENFTEEFWNHFCVVITHWNNCKGPKKRRLKNGYTDEKMADQINQFLDENFENSEIRNRTIYFTDTDEIVED